MTPTNAIQNKCAHCGSVVGKYSLYDDATGSYFCCDGCKTVYEVINQDGFSSYYEKRIQFDDGIPVEKMEATGECFEPYVKRLDSGLLELTFLISGIRCAACIWLIETSVAKEERIQSLRVNYANHKAKIVFDPSKISLDEVLSKITRLGYCPLPVTNIETESDKERKDYFYRFGVGAFFSMQMMIYSLALYAGYFQGIDEGLKFLFQIISWVLATPVMVYSAYPFFKKSVSALRCRHFTMDTLVAIGSGSAYLYSVAAIWTGHETYFDTSATIVTLILLGRFIEAGAKQKGGNAVNKLLSLRPVKVKLLEDKNTDAVKIIPIEQLKLGDYFRCEEGETFAADGKIVAGVCEINESMLTGEPLPAEKAIGAQVFAGTKIVSGSVSVITENIGTGTFLSKIAASVEDAQTTKAPIQDVADKFIGKFVPIVLGVAVATFFGWWLLSSLSVSDALMRAVSVLVIACPCAMGLATPLAIITASAKLSEKGLIFKNGEAIERFAGVTDFYFDKTGTITKGEMSVTDFYIADSQGNLDYQNMITSVAFYSKHPASKAVSFLNEELLFVYDFNEFAGKGVEAKTEYGEIRIGSEPFVTENIGEGDVPQIIKDKATKFIQEGLTIVYGGVNKKVVSIFGVSDTIRPEAHQVVSDLEKDGNKVAVLTGDNLSSATKVLSNNNITCRLYAGVSPFEKAEIIKSATHVEKTAMVGDGVNDAIALTAAGVGVAMRNGTDISMESASVVLLRNDLRLITTALTISKISFKIIKENLFWAFSYNLIAIPLAVTGYIHPVMSAVFMSVSSLLVIANSARIKKY